MAFRFLLQLPYINKTDAAICCTCCDFSFVLISQADFNDSAASDLAHFNPAAVVLDHLG
jgi:hypothetical protein